MSVEFFFKNSLPFNYVVINSHSKKHNLKNGSGGEWRVANYGF